MTADKPILVVACDTATFDISPWAAEGYTIHLLTAATQRDIEDATDDLESSDRYAILAFGSAATAALAFAGRPSRQLQAVVAYYPPAPPPAPATFHPDVRVLVHLPGSSPFSLPESQHVQVRVYDDGGAAVLPGFAQHGSRYYDRVAAALAFSRSLALLRATIGPRVAVDIEGVWDRHQRAIFFHGYRRQQHSGSVDCPVTAAAAAAVTAAVTIPLLDPQASITLLPTMVSACGHEGLARFYGEALVTPPTWRVTLLSRTVGVDGIVDEVVAAFRHSCAMPWMLPGVAATHREVELAIVFAAGFRAGRITAVRVYWDHASLLGQVVGQAGGLAPVARPEAAGEVAALE